MIYEKDPKTRYVDMAIYIDHHIYSGDFDPELVYQYLYFLSYMLAKKKRYFDSEKTYDDFAIWLATKMYVRLTDSKQFEDPPKLGKVVSILNYLKQILFAKKIEFNSTIEYQTVLGKFNSKYIKDFDDDALIDYYRPTVSSRNNDIIKENLFYIFETIPSLFRKQLEKSPYKKDKIMMENLYISCLLTFIKSTTVPNDQLAKVDKLRSNEHFNADVSRNLRMGDVEVVLWKVPAYLADYVKFVYSRVRDDLVDDIRDVVSKYTLDDKELTNVVNANYENIVKED